ncbi:hypothetical protein T492DRAFT_1100455 [Pavlovales sp. CCMP2436]|nr:hypothetical protein T492DRAFT_1100455 [Pavlovales sp. CCMP2436]
MERIERHAMGCLEAEVTTTFPIDQLIHALRLLGVDRAEAPMLCCVQTTASKPFTITAVDDAWCQRWEITREDAVGETLALIGVGSELSNARVGAKLRDATAGDALAAWVHCGSTLNYTRSGIAVRHHLVVGPVLDARGEICGLLGVSRIHETDAEHALAESEDSEADYNSDDGEPAFSKLAMRAGYGAALVQALAQSPSPPHAVPSPLRASLSAFTVQDLAQPQARRPKPFTADKLACSGRRNMFKPSLRPHPRAEAPAPATDDEGRASRLGFAPKMKRRMSHPARTASAAAEFSKEEEGDKEEEEGGLQHGLSYAKELQYLVEAERETQFNALLASSETAEVLRMSFSPLPTPAELSSSLSTSVPPPSAAGSSQRQPVATETGAFKFKRIGLAPNAPLVHRRVLNLTKLVRASGGSTTP